MSPDNLMPLLRLMRYLPVTPFHEAIDVAVSRGACLVTTAVYPKKPR
jgi:hypothetical protein